MNTPISTPTRSRIHERKGGTLISVIAVMLIIGVLGASIVTLNHSSEHSHLSANAGSRAYYLAESGLRYAQQIHCNQFSLDERGWRHGRKRTLALPGGEQVEIILIASTFWATAVVGAGTAQEARATVPMPLDPCGVDPEAADEFAVFGEVGIALGPSTVIQGDVAITDDGGVDIKGVVDGSVLANDINLNNSNSEVLGDVYSLGFVDVSSGSIAGDINSATGITLRSATSTVFDGSLFSEGPISVGGQAQVLGEIHACIGDGDVVVGAGNVSLSGSAIIGAAPDPDDPDDPGIFIEIVAAGNVDLSGFAEVYGDVYAGGSIIMGNNNTIHGNAYAGGTISESGTITEGVFPLYPYVKEPICPDLSALDDLNLPEAKVFTAGVDPISVPLGTDVLPTNYELAPGSYGALTSPDIDPAFKYTELSLNAGSLGHGEYYFDSILFGSNTTLKLDLSGTFDIRIFVVGNVTIGDNMNVLVSTDGTNYLPIWSADPLVTVVDPEIAARVYWESHGNFDLGGGSNWFGTVYTTEGSLNVGNGSNLFGSYFSGGGHDFKNGNTVFHVAPNYFAELAAEP